MDRYPDLPGIVARAAARPHCRFPVDWDAGFNTKLPHLARLRQVARLLCARAVLEARDGRMAASARHLRLALALPESLREEPGLISLLVRAAILSLAGGALREVGQWGGLPEEDARRLCDSLERMDLQRGFIRALDAERASGISLFEEVASGKVSQGCETGDRDGRPGEWVHPLTLAWFRADELAFLGAMESQIGRAHLALREMPASVRGQEAVERSLPRHATMSRMLVPVLSRAVQNRDRAQAQVAGARVFLALMVYRGRYGSYPETLAQLRQRLGWELPPDPCSGADLVYRRRGRGFLLYSIGVDLKDDGGRPVKWLRHRLGAGLLLGERPAREEKASRSAGLRQAGDAEEESGDLVWRRGR